MATYLPAAPGTFALRRDSFLYDRRAVIGWVVSETRVRPLVACNDSATVRAWANADAVERPDGSIESLSNDRVWSGIRDWLEDMAPEPD